MPITTEKELITRLSDPIAFQKAIKNLKDFTDLMACFPKYSDDLITQLKNDAAFLQRLMINAETFLAFVEQYSQETRELLDTVLANHENYPYLFDTYLNALQLLQGSSNLNYFESFHIRTAGNPSELQRLIESHSNYRIVYLEMFYRNARFLSNSTDFRAHVEKFSSKGFSEASYDTEKEIRAYCETKQKSIEAGVPVHNCADTMITQLTTNPLLFQSLIESGYVLGEFATTGIDKNHVDSLMRHVIFNRTTYHHLITSIQCIETLIDTFPRYAEELVSSVFFDQECFDRIVTLEGELMDLIKIIKDLTNVNKQIDPETEGAFHFRRITVNALFNDRNVKQRPYPNYIEALLERLDKSPNKKNLIITVRPLIIIGNEFQKKSEIRPYVTEILSDPTEFMRSVQTHKDLTELAKVYPNIRILKSGSINDIARNIQEYTKARDNASVLGH